VESLLGSLRDLFSTSSPDRSEHPAGGETVRTGLEITVRHHRLDEPPALERPVGDSSEAWPPARSAPSWFSPDGLPSSKEFYFVCKSVSQANFCTLLEEFPEGSGSCRMIAVPRCSDAVVQRYRGLLAELPPRPHRKPHRSRIRRQSFRRAAISSGVVGAESSGSEGDHQASALLATGTSPGVVEFFNEIESLKDTATKSFTGA
jgi:hypothetical protein